MNYDNYYSVLNLSKNANINDIKKAYRQLSIKFHPDKNLNCDSEQFNKINEAYSKLLDKYNTSDLHNNANKFNNNELVNANNGNANNGNANNGNANNGNANNGNANNGNANNGNANNIDINNTILKYSYFNVNNSEDIIINLSLGFNEAYNGCNKPIVVNRKIIVNNVIGHEKETLYIPIPKGIDANEIITIPNKGNVYISNGLISHSNIKIIICLLNHEIFERIGLDIVFIKTITLKEALLGFSFNLNHINNKNFKITCSEIIHFNYEKLIPNMGFIRDTFVGNLIIKFNITFPPTISQESKKLLEKAL
jgi:DnaJ family protein B protein 4